MNDFVKGVVQQTEGKLKAYEESIRRTADQGLEAVKRAREELKILEEATRVGASQSFLGAAMMLVGVSEYPVSLALGHSRSAELNFDHGQRIELHGDPEALKKLEGRYKAIVLLYKAD